jgi:hypothetical protein
MGDVVVKGNIIKNVETEGATGSSSLKGSAITVNEVCEGGKIFITENALANVEQGIAVYKYNYGIYYGEDWWEGPTSDNDIVVIKDNTIDEYKTFAIMTSKLNYKDATAGETTVEITGNAITSTVVTNAVVVEGTPNNWVVTATGNTLNGAAIG